MIERLDLVGGAFCGLEVSVNNMIEGCFIRIPNSSRQKQQGRSEHDIYDSIYITEGKKALFVGMIDYNKQTTSEQAKKNKGVKEDANEEENTAQEGVSQP